MEAGMLSESGSVLGVQVYGHQNKPVYTGRKRNGCSDIRPAVRRSFDCINYNFVILFFEQEGSSL